VPDLAPFRGLRYAMGSDLTAVTAPPYDVIDTDQRDVLLATHPNNSVRLILPEGGAGDAYQEAATTFAAWRADGTLVPDPTPMLYAYRMYAPRADGGTHCTLGVIGALALPTDPAASDVLPHERTLPKAKSDRLALLRATRANFDPIWALTLTSGLTDLIDDVATIATAVDADGVRHELGLIDDADRIAAVRALIATQPVVLADGHHRYETARTYRAESAGLGSDAILCLVVELDDAQLDVRPFHRLVRGAPGDLRERLADVCTVTESGSATPETVSWLVEEMDAANALGLVDGDGIALLVPSEALDAKVAELPSALHDVDAARFDVAIMPMLDGATLSYRSDAQLVAASVIDGTADAALLLRRVKVEQIRAAARARVLMPEKTTYFAPKPRTGMVMRALDT
jgi:uncharacterized protein (DUF1015 family)